MPWPFLDRHDLLRQADTQASLLWKAKRGIHALNCIFWKTTWFGSYEHHMNSVPLNWFFHLLQMQICVGKLLLRRLKGSLGELGARRREGLQIWKWLSKMSRRLRRMKESEALWRKSKTRKSKWSGKRSGWSKAKLKVLLKAKQGRTEKTQR